ncbi:DUF481 domain-containing protein [Flavobacteriaceae bacterium AH-315-O20]|nr:DUF481 domain-containing protein [Flavobacteriaceae bacterium AH-315-O20]
MHKSIVLHFLLLFFSLNVFAQNDTISKKELRKLKKEQNKITVYNDSIFLFNNNILVGEIKNMDKSVLTLKTKYSDSNFKIKWQKIVKIKSNRFFVVAMNDGRRFNSSINSIDNKDGKVVIDLGVNIMEENLIDIIYLEPIGKNFLSRLTIDVDFGMTLTKANNLRQITSNIKGTYLANTWKANGYYKTVFSRQDDIADVNRMDSEIAFNYYLKNDWFAQISGVYLSNDDQKLKLRSIYKAGAGYYFIHNNKMSFGASGGLANTKESYLDDTPIKNSAELYLGVGFNKYDIGDLSILTSAILYPSISEKGRYRSDINLDMKYDLPLDLYIKMSLTYNYDNQPIEGASKDDYVYTTSFGWEFN